MREERVAIVSERLMAKTHELWAEWCEDNIDPRLYAIIMAQMRFVHNTFGSPSVIEITSLYRKDPKSVHGHHRGVDWIVRGLSREGHELIRDWTNLHFPYQKPGYDTAKWHNAGSGYHMHNQVCDLKEVKVG